ncbi:sce7726 family protein [Prevotella communis]|uniref:sce7726 family protein n=1 Tax=Prevotella communis TaxID=2913614 RepID=UPI001EDB9A44|nr:sce7726 family protein [Prevotella communis]UKK56932.1 sce7726 family protein [Prevotella communis]
MCCDSAEKIKASVIDWLLASHDDIIIGNEVMYGSKRKVVDLLAIVNNKTLAIEIKSASDNLSRISEQIQEYSKIFDRVIIISSLSHKEGILSVIDKGIGLYTIDKKITKVRRPLLCQNQDKLEMLYSISSGHLKKKYPEYKTMNSDEIRIKLSRERKAVVHQLLLSFYQQRLTERFQLFMSERGDFTLIDDIPTLSSLTRIDQF